jgi:hypothetical protein
MNTPKLFVTICLLLIVLMIPVSARAQGPQVGPLQDILNALNSIQQQIANIPPTWSKKLQCDTTACPRFELVMDGAAVLDRETGLVWERFPDTVTLLWEQGQRHCYMREVGGRKGWRLPKVEEVASLVDTTQLRSGPALPNGHPFGDLPSVVWSITSNTLQPSSAWGVNLDDGNIVFLFKDSMRHTWCIRGADGHVVDGDLP